MSLSDSLLFFSWSLFSLHMNTQLCLILAVFNEFVGPRCVIMILFVVVVVSTRDVFFLYLPFLSLLFSCPPSFSSLTSTFLVIHFIMAKLRSGKGITSAASTSSATTPCPLMEFLNREELVVTSRLDEFRRFFDLQVLFWDEFRLKLKAWVSSFSSWVSVLNLESERRKIAESFLEENGPKFWGTDEIRKKYLMEESIESGDVCLWPERKEACVSYIYPLFSGGWLTVHSMTRGLMLLLEKTAKLTKERRAGSSLSTIPNLPGLTV